MCAQKGSITCERMTHECMTCVHGGGASAGGHAGRARHRQACCPGGQLGNQASWVHACLRVEMQQHPATSAGEHQRGGLGARLAMAPHQGEQQVVGSQGSHDLPGAARVMAACKQRMPRRNAASADHMHPTAEQGACAGRSSRSPGKLACARACSCPGTQLCTTGQRDSTARSPASSRCSRSRSTRLQGKGNDGTVKTS